MPSIIVEVFGDTKPLEKSLNTAKTKVNEFSSGFASGAAKAGIAAAGVYVLSQNLEQLGGRAGQAGKALNQLATGNLVGMVETLGDNSEEIKKMNANLLASGDAAKAGKAASQLAAAGFDDLAKSALKASQALQQMNNAYVDATKIHDSTSPGAIAAEVSGKATPKRRGVTQGQRNQWFDSKISRQLDRVQDVQTLKGQVSALNAMAAEIQKRINVTKDITRKLTLEDELVRVNRQRRGIEDLMEEKAKKITKAAAHVKKAVQDLGGPLTKTTQLSASILAGLGLSARDERILTARLSHFNSAGTALAGAGGGSITFHSTTVVDGKAIAKTSSKYNRRTRNVNTAQRNGPNAGGYTGRG